LAQQRLSRRQGIQAALGFGASAALLAACGGGSDGGKESSGGKTSSGLVGTPADTASSAKRGGIMVLKQNNDDTDFDPVLHISTSATRVEGVYSRLLKNTIGKYPKGPDGSIEGDAAESWELSPDATQITLKLRQNMPFDARPPTNGRPLTSADVKFTWDRQADRYAGRTDLLNSLSPEAPFLSMTAPDANTVVFKLAYPYAPVTELLAWSPYLEILPKEADGGFDAKGMARGTGPWLVDEYRQGAYIHYRRNQQYYDKQHPFLDGYDVVFMPEYATQEAQFRTGAVWAFDGVKQENVLGLKQELPTTNLYQAASFERGGTTMMGLGLAPGSVFMDERVRQAASMLQDRDLWTKTFLNTDKFEAQGLEVPTRWMTHIPPGESKYWLDPKDAKAFGDGAQYFQYAPAEARKLLQAALGNKLPIETPYVFASNNGGPVYLNSADVNSGFLAHDNDFKLKATPLDYASTFRPQYNDNKAGWDGIAQTNASSKANLDLFLYSNINSKGSKTKFPFSEPTVDDFILKQRQESNPAKRQQIIQDLQRYLAKKMYTVPYGAISRGFTISWPWLMNYQYYTAWSSPSPEAYPYYWYDESKKKS